MIDDRRHSPAGTERSAFDGKKKTETRCIDRWTDRSCVLISVFCLIASWLASKIAKFSSDSLSARGALSAHAEHAAEIEAENERLRRELHEVTARSRHLQAALNGMASELG